MPRVEDAVSNVLWYSKLSVNSDISTQLKIKSNKGSLLLLSWASCRIRTNDPEITNHVLWPTELKRRVGKQSISRRYNLIPLLPSSPGGFKGSWPYRTYPFCGCKSHSNERIKQCFIFSECRRPSHFAGAKVVQTERKSKFIFIFLWGVA